MRLSSASCLGKTAYVSIQKSACHIFESSSLLLHAASFSSSSSSHNNSSVNISPNQLHKEAFPRGFKAAGIRCGIKKKKDALDFAMIKSDVFCSAAAVFTTNKFQAAPVIMSRRLLENHSHEIGGLIINSGCANACTGDRGLVDAKTMMDMAAEVGIKNSLIMSTGVIGPFLDMDKIRIGIGSAAKVLSDKAESWQSASRAIMTTDTVPKLAAQKYELTKNKTFHIAGMCKGAGMIHPNMATMLGVITTDVAITPECLRLATKYAADRSFNSISVDGDMSTNDTLAVLANGQAENFKQDDGYIRSCLTSFASGLAQQLVRDGEGATKFVTIEVVNGRSYEDCKQVASSIATSALVKTAMYGQDANWGRIICAVGYSGIPLDANKVSLWFVDIHNDNPHNNLHLLKNGQPYQIDEDRASNMLKEKDIHIRVDIGTGKESATMWTCDFSCQP